MRIRSRLTQARNAAIEAAAAPAALVIWLEDVDAGGRRHRRGHVGRCPVDRFAARPSCDNSADGQSNFEDLDLVASSDEGSADAMEMLQDDIDFYDFADKAANSGPAA